MENGENYNIKKSKDDSAASNSRRFLLQDETSYYQKLLPDNRLAATFLIDVLQNGSEGNV